MAIPLDKVKEVVQEALSKVGYVPQNGTIDWSIMEDIHLSTIVKHIKSKFNVQGYSVILSEEKLKEFRTVDELAKWCFENQVDK